MKKNYLLSLLFLCATVFSFGQVPNWRYELPIPNSSSFSHSLGQIWSTENSIQILKEDRLVDVSYYGEHKESFVFNFPNAHFNDLFKRTIGNQDVYITTSLKVVSNITINVFSVMGENLGEDLAFESATAHIGNRVKISIIEKEDGSFVLFGREFFHHFKIKEDLTWEIIDNIPHDFYAISSAAKIGGQYFITTKEGKAILLSEDFETIWNTNIEFGIQSAKKTEGGYILCGHNNSNAFVAKINNNGAIQWSEAYENKPAFDILPVNGGFLVAGKNIFFINNEGSVLWEKEISSVDDAIYKLQKDSYDVILLMSKKALYRLNLNSTKPFGEHQKLASNNVAANLSSRGTLVNNKGLEYPIGTNTRTIFTDELAFTALTESATFKGFYNLFSTGEEFTGVLSPAQMTWKIHQSEINITQQKLAEGSNLKPYSQALLTYPAKGNPNCIINGDTIEIDYNLAPFVDVNEDGIYNMFDGDFPEMKGDEMIWWAMKHPASGIEIHGRWYAYDCGEHVVSNTIYTDYQITNTSVDNLPICFLGKLIDFDLGCHTDDYIGSLTDVNSAYVYNQDIIDGTTPGSANCDQGANTYASNIPIQSITFLNQELATSMYYNNGAAFPGSGSIPVIFEDIEYGFNQLQGIFSDGTHLTFGGSGYDVESTDFINHIFPGNPSNPDEWSMISEDIGFGDRRMITGTNAFSLNAGESKSFTFAYTSHANIPHPAPDVTPVAENIQQVTDIYDNGNAFAQVFLGQDQAIATGETITLNAGDDGLEYIWSTNEDGASIQVSAPGTYAVTVIDETGCQRSDEITINQATGITNVEITQLTIYPNPAKKGTSISIELPIIEEISIVKLFNIVGQEVYSESLMAQTQRLNVELSDTFSAGIYVVQLTSVEGKILVGKVVLN